MNREQLKLRAEQHQQYLFGFAHHILVCAGLGCPENEAIFEALRRVVAENHLEEQVLVRKGGCMGLCALGPMVLLQPRGNHLPPSPSTGCRRDRCGLGQGAAPTAAATPGPPLFQPSSIKTSWRCRGGSIRTASMITSQLAGMHQCWRY